MRHVLLFLILVGAVLLVACGSQEPPSTLSADAEQVISQLPSPPTPSSPEPLLPSSCQRHGDCQTGEYCEEGQCQELRCQDTDAADEPALQGTVTLTWSGTSKIYRTAHDECDFTSLRQVQCREGAISYVTRLCSLACKEGRCVEPLSTILFLRRTTSEEGRTTEERLSIAPDGKNEQSVPYAHAATSPDGLKTAYFSYTPGAPTSNLYVADADGRNGRQIVGKGSPWKTPDKLQWFPDSRRVAFESENKQVYIIDTLDVSNWRFLVGDDPDIAPNGATVVYVKQQRTAQNVNTGRAIALYKPGDDESVATVLATGSNPQFSPDGTKIAFDRGGLFVMDADGRNEKQLTTEQLSDGFEWSFDGRLAYWTVENGGQSIIVDRDEKKTMIDGKHLRFSPDGSQSVYNRVVNGAATLFVAKSDGTEERQLTLGLDGEWSADGNMIAFTRQVMGKQPGWSTDDFFYVFVINVDGSNEKQLAKGEVPEWMR